MATSDSDISKLIKLISKQIELQEKRFDEHIRMQKEQNLEILNSIRSTSNRDASNLKFAPFNSSEDLWKQYKARFLTFIEANNVSEKRIPLIFITNQSKEIFQILKTAAEQFKLPKEINELTWIDINLIMENNFDAAKFTVRERHRFYTETKRLPSETIQEYAARIREKATSCDFKSIKDPLDEALKTVFICNVNSETVLKGIFHRSKENLTFAQIVEVAAEIEDAVKSAKAQLFTNSECVNKVVKPTEISSFKKSTNLGPCYSCGKKGHTRQECRFREYVCNYCNTQGHLQAVCRKKKNNLKNENSNDNSEGVNKIIGSISQSKIQTSLEIQKQIIKFEIDTGSVDSFLNKVYWVNLGKPTLEPTIGSYRSVNGSDINVLGKFDCYARVFNENYYAKLSFVVTDYANLNLLGLNAIRCLKLSVDKLINNSSQQIVKTINNVSLESKCDQICKQFPNLWTAELGCIKDIELTIKFKPEFKEKFFKPRQVAYALREAVSYALDEGVSKGIWSPTQYNDSGTPIVPIRKSTTGKIRICGDYSTWINNYLEDYRFPIPQVDELMHQLGGNYYFSKIDLADAYNQITLCETSKKRLAISTHKGVFLQNRLPFGIKSAPGHFQEIMAKITANLKGVAVYLDDILVTGTDEDDHANNLYELLKRLSERGLKCNMAKCYFAKPQVEYLGHTISLQGISKGSNYDAVSKIARPKNVKELRTYLGAFQFYNKFIKDLATIAEPLYRLTNKNITWSWNKIQEDAFLQLKKTLTSNVILAHYDPKLPIGISCDASGVGVGVVLFHRYEDGSERPIAYASKVLTRSQKNYAQIHKEALSIIYGLNKFHQFLYGRKLVIVTDHKPLLVIFNNKGCNNILVANRLARWAIILNNYDYEIEYRKTQDHGNSDMLSRFASGEDLDFDKREDRDDIEMVCAIQYLTDHVVQTNPYILMKESKNDPLLSEVIKFTRNGWPKNYDSNLNYFSKIQNSLSLVNDCLFYGNRVVIPKILQNKILNFLHVGHFGVQRMKNLARTALYWPNIDKDIENLARNCKKCDEFRNTMPKVQNHPWEPASEPWSRIHIDHAINFLGSNWLVVIDSFSKYACVHRTSSISTTSTIRYLEEDFSHFGFPHHIVSDNATSFASKEFQDWCRFRGIACISGAPYHPATNGIAERFIQTFKRSMRKSELNPDRALQEFLHQYRRTPGLSGKSPSELLNNRQIRSYVDTFHPVANKHESISSSMPDKYSFVKPNGLCYYKNYNIKEDKSPRWLPAVISKVIGNRHVLLKIQKSNTVIKRHIEQLRPRYGEHDSDFALYYHSSACEESPTEASRNHSETEVSDIPRRSQRIRRPARKFEASPWTKPKVKKRGVMYKH